MPFRSPSIFLLWLFAFVTWAACPGWTQEISKVERGWAQDMLKTVANDIRNNYYDPKFHGVNWDAKVAETKQQIDQAPSMGMALARIAALVDSLNDSHTYFFPPGRAHSYDYGWTYQFIGERCYVTHIRPGSDAEAKGVKPGDEVLTINGFMPERKDTWKLDYLFGVLNPQPSLRVLMQYAANGSSREIELKTKIRQLKRSTDLSWSLLRELDNAQHYLRARGVELGDDLMVIKFPNFFFTNTEIADIMNRAQKHRTLIMDLRENTGGSVDTLKWFVGALFDKEVKIADRVTRKETKEIVSKPQRNSFTGKLIVLVDSKSASASEVLARVVQLEKRGTVIGDLTSASVMESRSFPNQLGGDLVLFYGETITDADLIMKDGKSLEHIGVTPDVVVLPTAGDLANGRDPVLAQAAEMAGVKLTPEMAGKLFPYEWPPDPQ